MQTWERRFPWCTKMDYIWKEQGTEYTVGLGMKVTHVNINTSIYKVLHWGFRQVHFCRCVKMDIVWMDWKDPSSMHSYECGTCEIAVCALPFQMVSLWPEEWSLLGVEARDDPLSVLSELELRCCCSEPALEGTVEEEVEEERVFSLKSVMITVTLPTVIASCWAELLSTFFSLGLKCNRGMEEEGITHLYYCRIYCVNTIT